MNDKQSGFDWMLLPLYNLSQYRIQQLHFEMAETLAELKELQLQNQNEEA